MSLCINPQCTGSELVLEGCYRVVSFLGGGFSKTYAIYGARTQTAKVLKIFINFKGTSNIDSTSQVQQSGNQE